MKKFLTVFTILSLAVYSVGAAKAANLLGNPDLDTIGVGDQTLATPIGGWHVNSSRALTGAYTDGASSETFANVLQAGGNGLFFKAFAGDLGVAPPTPPNGRVTTNLFQDVAGSPGSYSLTGWAGAGAGYIGLVDPTVQSQFTLQFLDASSTVLSTVVNNLNLNGLGVPDGNGFPFNYKQFTVSGVAPAGTITVRAMATQGAAYGNPAGGDQAFVVDSFDLERAVPEPASIALGLLGLVGFFGVSRRRS
ncbi:MAG TPA: PEP-CTERM sorting domain-containing protein [Lacipirellulaceae bacterium]|jgi:hypothetical protein|nr:PEP-CTERM sorting domain-containing protein [Lacipirellulaceae bacterium]